MKSKSIQILLFLFAISTTQAGSLVVGPKQPLQAINMDQKALIFKYSFEQPMQVEAASENALSVTANPLSTASPITNLADINSGVQSAFKFNHSSSFALSFFTGLARSQESIKISTIDSGNIILKRLAEQISNYIRLASTSLPVLALPNVVNTLGSQKSVIPIAAVLLFFAVFFMQRKQFNLTPELSMLQNFRC